MFGKKTEKQEKSPVESEERVKEQEEPITGESETASESDNDSDAQEQGGAETADIAELQQAFAAEQAAREQAEKKSLELKEQLVRTMADFENFRKRQIRDRELMERHANERAMEDFLPIVDHLEMALSKTDEEAKKNPFVQGIQLIYTQFIDAFAKHGMTPIDAKGEKFDPQIHEALTQIPSVDVPEGVVIDQFRRGWKIGDYLVRAAQVTVSSGAPAPETPSPKETSSEEQDVREAQ
ncbi:MAG: nucleotide exchange factor GrpE [Kiritimatiellae bacterium]|nr:nucleotide exchange factor GrpE [Kiritimatiellia bacterium]